jgi:hypothetical protein
MTKTSLVKYTGGCHCGAVRFEVRAPASLEAVECNCSICARVAFMHLVVPRARFTLRRGEESLTRYTFNTKVAQHLFCCVCGVKSFYVPRSHPDGYSVNVRCLDGVDPGGVRTRPFDGAHWEEHAGELTPLDD